MPGPPGYLGYVRVVLYDVGSDELPVLANSDHSQHVDDDSHCNVGFDAELLVEGVDSIHACGQRSCDDVSTREN